jgi:hypothetical protein
MQLQFSANEGAKGQNGSLIQRAVCVGHVEPSQGVEQGNHVGDDLALEQLLNFPAPVKLRSVLSFAFALYLLFCYFGLSFVVKWIWRRLGTYQCDIRRKSAGKFLN